MSVRRLLAIASIFGGASVAWAILGSSVLARTGQFDSRLQSEVELLWGGPHRQAAPDAWVERPDVDTEIEETKGPDGRVTRREVTKPVVRRIPVVLASTRATADLDLEHRRKGLLWYPTYSVAFEGRYTFRNPDTVERAMRVRFPLPAGNVLFDDFVFAINGQPAAFGADVSKEMFASVTALPEQVITVAVRYRSRGLEAWTYAFTSGTENRAAQVRDFQLAIDTNVENIDFTAGSISPNTKTRTGDGWRLQWTFESMLSGQSIGLALPNRLNPGPFAARVTFFAPVGLLFFLTGMRHALFRAGAAQAVFLVLFSYAFFFEGVTGLAITVGAILTLFVLMQITARVSWDDVFDSGDARFAGRHGAAG